MYTGQKDECNSAGLTPTPTGAVCGNTIPTEMNNVRLMTYGEKCVGLTFNPSGDKKVEKIKRLYAEIIDLVTEQGIELTSFDKEQLRKEAVKQAQTAQMWAVKAITYQF